ncbi:peptidoglycan DD-metalloendopeptidase family protein [Halomonas salifodinae]|uniref:peptidoglycan DD-metalloendopeptidase family protein n=1 Tax=Halomonas salifodinae TaxID=438745 RepID=UPI00339FB023
MRKALLVSAVALAMAGCAAQQQPGGQVSVRDLSVAREATAPASYTVEPGDTLYGIAWRHDMDYRELARLNQIGPPYLLQPGQQLRLGSGETGQALAGSAEATPARGVQVTPLGEAPADSDLDWLAPDESAIERNRRLSATPLGGEAVAAAGQVAEAETAAPGPVVNPESPGADGRLSERDLAEREARQAQETASREPAVESPRAESRDTGAREVADTESSSAPVDTDSREAAAAPAEEAAPASRNGQRTYTPVAEVPWQWPAEGELVGGFGDGGNITAGIDIAGQKGQPVKAAGPGIVVYAGSGVRGYGNLILLKHNDEYLSAYAHNDSLRVSENDVVEAGEVIATMGDTDADRVKLHFEVRRNGQPQDPLTFLPSR